MPGIVVTNSTVLYCIIQYCTVSYVQYCTVQYCTYDTQCTSSNDLIQFEKVLDRNVGEVDLCSTRIKYVIRFFVVTNSVEWILIFTETGNNK